MMNMRDISIYFPSKLMLGVYSHLVVIGVGFVASLFFPKPVIDKNLLYSGWRENKYNEKTAALQLAQQQ